MRKLATVIAVMVVASFATPMVMAEGDGLGIDITADFFSKYVWRGQLLNDNYVFQPGISTTMGGLTLGVWGNMDMTNEATKGGDMTEVDYYVDYSGDLTEGIAYSIGAVYYDFPTYDPVVDDTTEIYVGLAFDLPLCPSITWNRDVDDVDEASYWSFALGHSIDCVFELASDVPVGMELGASLGYGDSGYNSGYWGEKDAGINDLAFSMALPFEIGGWSVTPSFNYVTIANSDLRSNDSFGSASDHFFTGISLGTSF